MTVEICACGRPLHYTDPVIEAILRQQTEELGEFQKITVPSLGTWLVQRHFIALHGIKAWELPESEWEKVG